MPAAPAGRSLPPGRDDHPCRDGVSRRGFILGSSAMLASLLIPRVPFPAAQAAGPAAWDAAAYWAFADRVQAQLDPYWRGKRYEPARAMYNATLLLTHSAAALAGHTGPARRDERAHALIRALCEPPTWVRAPATGSQGHMPGWRDSLSGGGIQHLVVDTEIAWGLAMAWRARDALGLDRATADLIAERIISTTEGTFWRWPALRLNQSNWYARMYQAAASVGGDRRSLHDQLLRQLRRFVDGAKRPMDGAAIANLGPGYRFHYLPHVSERHKYNLDSTEYANIVCGFLVAYQQAREQGMPALDRARAQVVRAWSERVLAGYWTHAGYLNWDTGLGFKRWHQGKKVGLSQAALLGIATCPELAPNGPWAKHILDRSFELYDRWIERSGVPPANAFGVPSINANESSAVLALARVQANAAQAALLRLGEQRSAEPPPLYAYDPDVGRLAVTTPAYNTAIVAVTRGAFPYGGIELARLFDGRQEVAGGIGGRPPASFGIVVRDASGAIAHASQRALAAAGDPPLELLDAPRGRGSDPAPYPDRPYAGEFSRLRVRGSSERDGVRIQTTHTFRAEFIETEWRVTGAGGKRVEALFPSWGRGARITKLDGAFHVQSEHTGYVVVLRRGGGQARTLRPQPQASAPSPGPTLAVRARGSVVVARIAPARTAQEARAVAARLGA
jgi:hypothetical protein